MSHQSGGILKVQSKSGTYAIEVATQDRPKPFGDPRIKIFDESKSWILKGPNLGLLDPASAAESLPASYDVTRYRAMMAEALDLIRSADPDLYEEIESIIGWYVPVRTNDIKIHRSFTVERMPGVIFLSEALNSTLLAEAIVHEFYHAVLHVLTETQDVFGQVDPEQRFYSPWRDDARPLSGLFHALYVFSGVFVFYSRVTSSAQHVKHHDVAYKRVGKLHRQLQLGLAQIPMDSLAPAGSRIIERIGELLRRYPRVEVDSAIREGLESHLHRWTEKNPNLTVRKPSLAAQRAD
jgi:hypothetical protein